MRYAKMRALGVLLIVLFAGMMYYNWHRLHSEGVYSLKMAAFGPVGIIGGAFIFLFPAKGGKPETTRDKVIALVVLGIGLLAGVANVYMMDPGFFGQ